MKKTLQKEDKTPSKSYTQTYTSSPQVSHSHSHTYIHTNNHIHKQNKSSQTSPFLPSPSHNSLISKTPMESNTPQLQLTSFTNLNYQQYPYSSALTPLHTSASIPFSWEQEPGKPLPCLTLTIPPSSHHNDIIKCLDLPPRLLNNEGKFTKTPSPTTVLEGPYSLGRSILGSSSFRFLRKRQKSFDGELSFTGSRGSSSPEICLVSSNVVSSGKKDKRLFGSWKRKGGKGAKSSEVDEGSFVISSFSDDGCGSCYDVTETEDVGRVRTKAKSHFWATIYGTFRQVIPKRRTRCRKDAQL